jgi:hypothetical protein
LGFELADGQKPLWALSAATRQAFDRGSVLRLDRENWSSLAQAHVATPVREKVRLVLESYGRRSKYPGDGVQFDEELDYPLFDAASPVECAYLLRHVYNTGFVENCGAGLTCLSTKGWEQIQPSAGGGSIPGRCFVAMSFDQALDEAYFLGIKPAIEQDCAYSAVRVKEVHHNGDICDKILSEIRVAQFVVADFTQHKNGVYYEAGFARALGREVICSCQETDFGDLHFDTNHLNHLKWSTPAELRIKLAERIRATILP